MSRGGHIEILISEVGSRRILWDMRNKNYHNRYAVDEEWTQVAKAVDMSSNEAKAKWKSLRDSFRRELKKMPQRECEENTKQWRSKWAYFESMLFLRDVMKFKDTHGNDVKTPRHSSDTDDNHTNDSADYRESCLNGEGGTQMAQKKLERFSMNVQKESQSSDFPTHRSPQQPDSGSRKHFSGNEIDPSKNSRHNATPKKRKRHDRMDRLERMIQDLEKKRELLQNNEDVEEDDDLSFFKSLLPYIRKLPPLKKLQIRSQYQMILINEIHEMENKKNTASEFSNFTYPSSSSSSTSTSTAASPVRSLSMSPVHYRQEQEVNEEENEREKTHQKILNADHSSADSNLDREAQSIQTSMQNVKTETVEL